MIRMPKLIWLLICITGLLLGIGIYFFWLGKNECRYELIEVQETAIRQEGVSFLVAVPRKNAILTASKMGHCVIWDANSFSAIRSFSLPTGVTDFDLSSDGRFLVAGTDKATIIDTDTWMLRELPITGIRHRFLAGASDSIVVVDGDNNIRAFRTRDGFELRKVCAPRPFSVYSMATAHGINLVAAGGEDGAILIWDFSNGELIFDGKMHGGKISALLILCKERRLVAADMSGALGLWDITTNNQLALKQAHDGGITAITSNEREDICFTAAADRSIRASRTEDLSECWRVNAHNRTSSHCLARSGDQNGVLFGMPTGSVRLIRFKEKKNPE